MRGMSAASCLSAALSLTACGGSGTITAESGMNAGYSFVTPILNSTQHYAETIVDNSNNTVTITFDSIVTAVNGDGSFALLQQSTSGNGIFVNGTNYAALTENQTYNNVGQETGYSYTGVGNRTVFCIFNPHAGGVPYPVAIQQTFVHNYTFSCDTLPPTYYAESGEIVDVESVIVPAGTFSALKVQSTLVSTDSAGTTRTEVSTSWRDVITSTLVKQQTAIVVTGTQPASGYAISRVTVLESTS